MCDLVHDLAQSIMKDECHVMEVGSSTTILNRSARHVTSIYDFKALENVKFLRTLFVKDFSDDIMKFSTLRVLDASRTYINELPSSIGNLIHLRYLNLSLTNIRTLPKSLCKLLNLQTLNLNTCCNLQRLPKYMRRLTNLRHLFVEECTQLTQMAPKLGQLTSLKTLSLFIVDRRRGFHLGELGGLNLGGKLSIKHLKRVENSIDAKKANLVGKQHVYSLHLFWESEESESLPKNAEGVLEALQPHPNLKELFIEEYPGTSFPLWMQDQVLENLVVVSLFGCKNCRNLPPYGRLRFLKHLKVSGMKDVKYIDDDNFSRVAVRRFPSLEVVEISELLCLERFSRDEETDELPHLSLFSIKDFPNLTFPRFSSLQDLDVWGGSDLSLSSLPNVSCLTSLELQKNHHQVSFPEGMLRNLTALQSLKIIDYTKLSALPNELSDLSALKSLAIYDSGEIESLPEQGLQGLNSLRYLDLRGCGKLKSLSEALQHLKALETLIVWRCPELVSLPEGIKRLHFLQNLEICHNPKLVVFPEALQYVPALQSLKMLSNLELTSLPDWLGNLASLQQLSIWYCPKIVSLPDSIQRLWDVVNSKGGARRERGRIGIR